MRFDRLRVRGLGPFTNEIDLDLAGIDGRVVAITGVNGSGKSTLLELWPGAIYRQCPTRGSLMDLATMRGAFVESTVYTDRKYLIRQNVDPISRKGETMVLDESGNPLVSSAKVREFDQWVAKHLPSATELYSSSFAVQGRRGILDMAPGERKGLLVRLLGLEKLEALAEVSRDRVKGAKVRLDQVMGKLSMVAEVDMDALTRDRQRLEQELALSAEALKQAEQSLVLAVAAAADSERLVEISGRRDALEILRQRKSESLGKVNTDLADALKMLERADEIAAAQAEVERLRPEVAELDERTKRLLSEVHECEVRRNEVRSKHQNATERQKESEKRAGELKAHIENAADPETVARLVAEAEGQVDEHQAAVAAVTAELDAIQDAAINGKDNRITVLRVGLQTVEKTTVLDPVEIARAALAEDDALAERLAAMPDAAEQRKVLTQAERVLAASRAKLTEMNAAAVRLEELERIAAEYEQLGKEIAERVRTINVCEVQLREADAALFEVKEKHAVQSRLLDAMALELRTAELVARGATEIERARASEQLLGERAGVIVEEIADIDRELAGLPELPDDFEPVDLSGYRSEVEKAKAGEREVRASIVRTDEAIERARQAHEQRAVLAMERGAIDRELSGWNHLATAFGRDGLQALEMNAALPEINAIANDLLLVCHGSRFTVEVSTDKLSADGKKQLETLEIRVIDTTNGRDATIETYSGGECVIVGEALSLALTTVACRHNAVTRPTLIRDESGAALDPANGRAYMAMLRRAADMVDADKVLVVSHSQEIQDLADARVVISDGSVTYQ